jgi:ribulose bisphosphate carboxylase small subunit
MFVETDRKYHSGFEVLEYKGKVQFIQAKQPQDKVWQVWGEIEIGKDKTKRLPVSVEIGQNRKEAIKTLEHVIHYLRGAAPAKEDEVPF